MDASQVAQTFSAAVQAASAVVLVVLTRNYVRLTRDQLKASTEPRVVIYIRHDEKRPHVLQIVIENLGKGVARDVRFECSEGIPDFIRGELGPDGMPLTTLDYSPLIDGIPALAPGGTRYMAWGICGAIVHGMGDRKIHVTCRFKHGNEEMTPTDCILEAMSHYGVDANEHDD